MLVSDHVLHDWVTPGAWRRGRTTTVKHMDLAIYLHMLHLVKEADLEVQAIWRIGRGQHEFVFDDPNDVISDLQLRFANDRLCGNLMAAQRSLKTAMRERACERNNSR